jgi:S1-C subfamily serine protease
VHSKRAVLAQMLTTSAQIFVEREGGVRRAGSGVVISTGLPQGTAAVLTTAHLLEPAVEQSAFVVAGGHGERIPADIVAIDATRDLALMMARIPGVSQAALAGRAELADEILIVAFPWGRKRTVVKGAVSQIAGPASIEDPFSISGPVALVDATVSYGMSGGGVFDKQSGHLVGLVRGYRTAHLSLSSEDPPLKLPIAGETTIISTRDIVCFLRSFGYEGMVANSAAAVINERDCRLPG